MKQIKEQELNGKKQILIPSDEYGRYQRNTALYSDYMKLSADKERSEHSKHIELASKYRLSISGVINIIKKIKKGGFVHEHE